VKRGHPLLPLPTLLCRDERQHRVDPYTIELYLVLTLDVNMVRSKFKDEHPFGRSLNPFTAALLSDGRLWHSCAGHALTKRRQAKGRGRANPPEVPGQDSREFWSGHTTKDSYCRVLEHRARITRTRTQAAKNEH